MYIMRSKVWHFVSKLLCSTFNWLCELKPKRSAEYLECDSGRNIDITKKPWETLFQCRCYLFCVQLMHLSLGDI